MKKIVSSIICCFVVCGSAWAGSGNATQTTPPQLTVPQSTKNFVGAMKSPKAPNAAGMMNEDMLSVWTSRLTEYIKGSETGDVTLPADVLAEVERELGVGGDEDKILIVKTGLLSRGWAPERIAKVLENFNHGRVRAERDLNQQARSMGYVDNDRSTLAERIEGMKKSVPLAGQIFIREEKGKTIYSLAGDLAGRRPRYRPIIARATDARGNSRATVSVIISGKEYVGNLTIRQSMDGKVKHGIANLYHLVHEQDMIQTEGAPYAAPVFPSLEVNNFSGLLDGSPLSLPNTEVGLEMDPM